MSDDARIKRLSREQAVVLLVDHQPRLRFVVGDRRQRRDRCDRP